MSPSEKPLHVKVAEALGWRNLHPACEGGEYHQCGDILLIGPPRWHGIPPDSLIIRDYQTVPNYDLDWSATGPLIERFGLDVDFTPWKGNPKWKGNPNEWTATAWLPVRQEPKENKRVARNSPLLAICHLILALHEAGRLSK